MRNFLTDVITLENAKVRLIPFEEKTAGALRDIIFDNEVWKYMGMQMHNETHFRDYVADTLSQQFKTSYPFLIIDKLTNEVAGSTRYGHINFNSEKLEIGWTWIGKKFQGTDLNKACKYELIRYGFEEIGLRRIQWSADLENTRSQRAIEKLGAAREGLFRNNYIDAQGKSRHDVYYSMIKEDWPNIKGTFFPEYD